MCVFPYGHMSTKNGQGSAVGNLSDYGCLSGPVQYFRGDNEIISTVILLPSHGIIQEPVVLVNCLFKLAQEKVWLGELTVPP